MGFINPAKNKLTWPNWVYQLVSRPLTLLFIAVSITSCQFAIVDKTIETVASAATGIKNIPSAILPRAFESTARIDKNFSISNAAVAADGEYAILNAFFATNRTVNEEASPSKMFREGRGSDPVFGRSYITVKRSGDTFDIEPKSLIKVAIQDGPTADATLSHNELISRQNFSKELNSAMEKSGNNDMLIFIHGATVSFEEASTQSAQLSYDLGFTGTTVFYSWPARGDTAAYIVDVESAQKSQQHFESMMNDILYLTQANEIYLVAHSMGARLMSRAMKSVFYSEPRFRSRIKEILLVAPDIDTVEFSEELAPSIGTEYSPITLYVAGKNPSLAQSRCLNNQKLAGDNSDSLEFPVFPISTGENPAFALAKCIENYEESSDESGSILISKHVETINVGNADTSFSSHTNYLDKNSVVYDVRNIIFNNLRARDRRHLIQRNTPEGTYWQYAQ